MKKQKIYINSLADVSYGMNMLDKAVTKELRKHKKLIILGFAVLASYLYKSKDKQLCQVEEVEKLRADVDRIDDNEHSMRKDIIKLAQEVEELKKTKGE